jgi:hypothetical protein
MSDSKVTRAPRRGPRSMLRVGRIVGFDSVAACWRATVLVLRVRGGVKKSR